MKWQDNNEDKEDIPEDENKYLHNGKIKMKTKTIIHFHNNKCHFMDMQIA